MGRMVKGEEVLRQCLVLGAGRCKAEARDQSLRIDGDKHVEALVAADIVPYGRTPPDASLIWRLRPVA